MLKEGAGARNGTQIAEAAAAMGGDLSIREDNHQTTLSLAVLSERASDAIALIADMAQRPSFPAAAFGRVKDDQLRNLAITFSVPARVADYALGRAIYGAAHPYGAIPSAAGIGGYTLDQAKAFHAANFGAGRAHLYVGGQFDSAKVEAAIRASFDGWAKGGSRTFPYPTATPGPHVVLVDRPGAAQSSVRLRFPAPVRTDPETLQLDVTDAMLGGAFSSRITTNIREDKGYTYNPFSTVTYRPLDADWTEHADVTTAVTGASIQEIYNEIKGVQTTAPSASETEGIRTYLAGQFTLRNSYMDGLLSSLEERDLLGLPADWLERYIPGVLAVERAQVQAQAIKTFPIEAATLVVVGDLNSVGPQLRAQPSLKNARFVTVTVP